MGRTTIICVLLAVVTAAVFVRVPTYDFVSYDDDQFVTKNPHVRQGLTFESIAWSIRGNVDYWRPLSLLSHMLDCDLYGLEPAGHHLSSVLIHLVNTLLLFAVLHRLTAAVWRSALTAALFALHPLHVESVAWIAERKDVLSTFFGLLAIGAYAAYARRRSVRRYLGVFLLLAASLAAKPMLVTLPLLFLLLDVWPLGRLDPDRSGKSTSGMALPLLLVEKIPLLALVAAISVATVIFQQEAGAIRSAHLPIHDRAVHAAVSYVMYLGKTVWPTGLSVFHPHPYLHANTPWAATQITGTVVLLLVLSAAAAGLVRHRWYPIVGWLWFLGAMVPVIGVLHTGLQGLADRYTYVPLIGLFVISSWGLGDLVRACGGNRLPACTIAAAILTACAWTAFEQTQHWRDSQTLFARGLSVYPDDPVLHSLMGGFHLERQEYAEAINHFERSTSADPSFDDGWQNLGTVYLKLDQPEIAIGHYRTALQIRPDAESHYSMAMGLKALGRSNEAMEHFRQSLRLNPAYSRAWNAMGVVLASAERLEEAFECFKRAIRIDPWYAQAYFNLGAAYEVGGDLNRAVHYYGKALRVDRNFDQAQQNLDRLQLRGSP